MPGRRRLIPQKVRPDPCIRMSIAITKQLKGELEALAVKQHIPTSELVRIYIARGMNIDKTASDMDFIRTQIREEINLALKPQINRLAKLLMRIGMMTVSFCYFTSKIVHLFVPFTERTSYEELMRESKHDAAAYLNTRDANVDSAHDIFNEHET